MRRALGFIDEDRAAAAAQAPIPQEVRAFPDRAYHAAYAEFIRRSRGAAPRRLTLDAGMQAAAERVAARYAAQADDGANVSVLIVESATRAVRAHVGAAARAQPGGWIDLTRAVRSPGSTLKPLIYALAFDSGLARADTILIDAPRPFGDYAPANFDGAFRGAVPLADALRHSLNVPAVATLDRVGAARLENTLTASGLPVRRADRDAPGLALALGGAGLRAVDLATLYAALADDGVVAPLRPRVASADDEADALMRQRIISPEAARAIEEILVTGPSLEGRPPAGLTRAAPKVAFKTGTSYGYRDAWAAGWTPSHTIVVWVGRADGAPRPGATGRRTAAPILFELADGLSAHADAPASDIARPAPRPTPRPTRQRVSAAPQIVFPRTGAVLFADGPNAAEGLALRAWGGEGARRWYVNGAPIPADADGRARWRASRPGFYRLSVVDGAGRSAQSSVRVVARHGEPGAPPIAAGADPHAE